MFKKIATAWGYLLCFLGLHAWKDSETPGAKTIIYFCTRPNCKKASRLGVRGNRITWTREEVTAEQVQKLNRHERRRLGSLARRGAFGKIPTTAGVTHD